MSTAPLPPDRGQLVKTGPQLTKMAGQFARAHIQLVKTGGLLARTHEQLVKTGADVAKRAANASRHSLTTQF